MELAVLFLAVNGELPSVAVHLFVGDGVVLAERQRLRASVSCAGDGQAEGVVVTIIFATDDVFFVVFPALRRRAGVHSVAEVLPRLGAGQGDGFGLILHMLVVEGGLNVGCCLYRVQASNRQRFRHTSYIADLDIALLRVGLIPAELRLGHGVGVLAAVRGVDGQVIESDCVSYKDNRVCAFLLSLRCLCFFKRFFYLCRGNVVRFLELVIRNFFSSSTFLFHRIRPRQRKRDIRETAGASRAIRAIRAIRRIRRQRQNLLHLEFARVGVVGVGEVRALVRRLHLVHIFLCRLALAPAKGNALDHTIGELLAVLFVIQGQLGCIFRVLVLSIGIGIIRRIAGVGDHELITVLHQIRPVLRVDGQCGDGLLPTCDDFLRRFRDDFALVIPIHLKLHRRQVACFIPVGQVEPLLLAVDGIGIAQRVDKGVVFQQRIPGVGVASPRFVVIIADAVGGVVGLILPNIGCITQVQRDFTELSICGGFFRQLLPIQLAVAVADDVALLIGTLHILHRLIVIIADVYHGALDGVILNLIAEGIVFRHVIERHNPAVVLRGVAFNLAFFSIVQQQRLHAGFICFYTPQVVLVYHADPLLRTPFTIFYMLYLVNIQIDIRALVIVAGVGVAPLLIPGDILAAAAVVPHGNILLVQVAETAFVYVGRVGRGDAGAELLPGGIEVSAQFGFQIGFTDHRPGVVGSVFLDPNLLDLVVHDLAVAVVLRQVVEVELLRPAGYFTHFCVLVKDDLDGRNRVSRIILNRHILPAADADGIRPTGIRDFPALLPIREVQLQSKGKILFVAAVGVAAAAIGTGFDLVLQVLQHIFQRIVLARRPGFGGGHVHRAKAAVGDDEQGLAIGCGLLIGHLIAVVIAFHAAVGAGWRGCAVFVYSAVQGFVGLPAISQFRAVRRFVIADLMIFFVRVLLFIADVQLHHINVLCFYVVRQADEVQPHVAFQLVGYQTTVLILDRGTLTI